jgi:hypothetical protein
VRGYAERGGGVPRERQRSDLGDLELGDVDPATTRRRSDSDDDARVALDGAGRADRAPAR